MAQISLCVDDDMQCNDKQIFNDISVNISADPFYSESNIKYLEGIVSDVKSGKAHFAEHSLIEAEDDD